VLINAQLAHSDLAGAEQTYLQASARASAGDAAGLKWLRQRIDRARAASTPEPAPTP
jgi:hypothetical protein